MIHTDLKIGTTWGNMIEIEFTSNQTKLEDLLEETYKKLNS